MSKTIYERVYELCLEGLPAKKICTILRRDKGRISRIISAFEQAGFLYCINPGDKVKFYEATTKTFSPDEENTITTILREKPCKTSYGGYTTRVHGISFKADVVGWKKSVSWDHTWVTNCTRHFMLGFKGYTVIRHRSKKKDTLVLFIPDVLWNVCSKGSVSSVVRRKARVVLGEFAGRYGVSLRNFVECGGTSYALPVRDPGLVKLAQKKTVYFDNGVMLDASHGVPEFEAPLNMMQDLLSLPARVSQLEDSLMRMSELVSGFAEKIDGLSSQLDRIEKMFSQPSIPDEKRDVT